MTKDANSQFFVNASRKCFARNKTSRNSLVKFILTLNTDPIRRSILILLTMTSTLIYLKMKTFVTNTLSTLLKAGSFIYD